MLLVSVPRLTKNQAVINHITLLDPTNEKCSPECWSLAKWRRPAKSEVSRVNRIYHPNITSSHVQQLAYFSVHCQPTDSFSVLLWNARPDTWWNYRQLCTWHSWRNLLGRNTLSLCSNQQVTRTSEALNHHPRTPIEPFSKLSALSTIGWCPENFVMISLTVQELSRWQTDRQTNTQTDITENNTTLAARMITKCVQH